VKPDGDDPGGDRRVVASRIRLGRRCKNSRHLPTENVNGGAAAGKGESRPEAGVAPDMKTPALAGVVERIAARVLRRWLLPPHGTEAGEAEAKQGEGRGLGDVCFIIFIADHEVRT